jgi:ArsR family transcriptional regulator, arsenate/arsenite/antimonite-responsive transcriptional repressor
LPVSLLRAQPTISHHLKVLHEAGLLDRAKRGVWVYYRAALTRWPPLAC